MKERSGICRSACNLMFVQSKPASIHRDCCARYRVSHIEVSANHDEGGVSRKDCVSLAATEWSRSDVIETRYKKAVRPCNLLIDLVEIVKHDAAHIRLSRQDSTINTRTGAHNSSVRHRLYPENSSSTGYRHC